MPLQGTLVNVIAIIVGSILGRYLGHLLSERVRGTVISGMGLAVLLIGFQLAFQTKQPLILIGSIILGGIAGEALHIEATLDGVGRRLQERFSGAGNVAEAFVTASLLYCVGALAIMGSIQDGLGGSPSILYAKSALDGVASVALASTLGIGVIFSALPVLVYQGLITMAAGSVQFLLTDPVIAEMNAVGGLLIVGIGLDLLKIKKIPVGNLLPGIFVAPVLVWIFL
ncbi:MAG TPA: DUF554 domain-containing protein [Proteobacteria bacterium]|nr:putative membrane protein YdfK [bacterium BMS3Abin14]HDL52823.1 DUF554 domain-containing protein [Pseudomonadota bacterium]